MQINEMLIGKSLFQGKVGLKINTYLTSNQVDYLVILQLYTTDKHHM